MKLTYYGTAAYEAIPALYCSCAICEHARKTGGKEIRSRHLTTVDEDIQFDLSPDFFYHTTLGFEPRAIKHMIITHAHSDHFVPDSLNTRRHPYSLTEVAHCQLICNHQTALQAEAALEASPEKLSLTLREIAPYSPIALDESTMLTALPANHAPNAGGGYIYLLTRDGRTLLYAHDTGIPADEVFDYLKGKTIHAASLDCTGAYLGAGQHHMHIPGCEQVIARLKEMGILAKDAVIILNHFSHGGGATQAQLEEEAKKRGWVAAYDGMSVTI